MNLLSGRTSMLGVMGALLIAAPAPAPAHVKVGHGQVGNSLKTGSVWACGSATPTAAPARPWIKQGRFYRSLRPALAAQQRWPQASFSLKQRRFSGNGLPLGTATGSWPVAASHAGFAYATQSAALRSHQLRGSLPSAVRASSARCVSARQPVALARNGVVFLPSFNRQAHDLAALALEDQCGGTTNAQGLYFYRALVPCLDSSARLARGHSKLVGWARDGYRLYGEHQGKRTPRLDRCGGHAHRLNTRGRYHYHLRRHFPYTMSCFRGRKLGDWKLTAEPQTPPQPSQDPVAEQPTPPPPTTTASPSQLKLTANPSLTPEFDPAISDYVARCTQDPLLIEAELPDGHTLEVDGQAPRSGRFSASVSLRSGQSLTLRLKQNQAESLHHVRCLPLDFPAYSARRLGDNQAQWYLTTLLDSQGSYAVIFDREGVPLWWYATSPPALDLKLLSDGTLAWANYLGGGYATNSSAAYQIRNLDGSLVRMLRTSGTPTDHHDLQLLANGNYLMVSYKARDGVDLSPYGGPASATVLDAEIQEITPEGSLVWSWNSADHVKLEETDRWYEIQVISGPGKLSDGRTAYDITHINSVEPTPDGGVIFSLRHTDALYKIDRASGEVVWKLGGTQTPQSLAILGDEAAARRFGGQHDARLLADGTLTLHDNATGRGTGPQALRYRIDQQAKTATLLEAVGDSAIPQSGCCGSARRTSTGSWVMSWGGTPLITELDANGQRLFRLDLTGGAFTYRAIPVESGQGLTAEALRTAMSTRYPR